MTFVLNSNIVFGLSFILSCTACNNEAAFKEAISIYFQESNQNTGAGITRIWNIEILDIDHDQVLAAYDFSYSNSSLPEPTSSDGRDTLLFTIRKVNALFRVTKITEP